MATKIHQRTSARTAARRTRHLRIRKKVHGTPARPRLVVCRSAKHVEGQVVDDVRGVCLTGFSTRSKEMASRLEADTRKTTKAKLAGTILAERARAIGVEAVVFDRGGYRYHGRVRAFAEGAREGGLKF
ncbi:MAG: 50S ribosomal protein L18 [Gemmatimonadota bacterium]